MLIFLISIILRTACAWMIYKIANFWLHQNQWLIFKLIWRKWIFDFSTFRAFGFFYPFSMSHILNNSANNSDRFMSTFELIHTLFSWSPTWTYRHWGFFRISHPFLAKSGCFFSILRTWNFRWHSSWIRI